MNDPLSWLTQTARSTADIAAVAGVYVSRALQPDRRPVCPACLRRVNIEDEIFMTSRLSYHGSCMGYKRPKRRRS